MTENHKKIFNASFTGSLIFLFCICLLFILIGRRIAATLIIISLMISLAWFLERLICHYLLLKAEMKMIDQKKPTTMVSVVNTIIIAFNALVIVAISIGFYGMFTQRMGAARGEGLLISCSCLIGIAIGESFFRDIKKHKFKHQQNQVS